MFASVENQRKIRKHETAINTIFVVLMPDSGPPFSKVNDKRARECGPVRRAPYLSPVWVLNLFMSQFRKARMSLSEFRPKPLIGKIFVYKHCFCFCFFHTPCVFHQVRYIFHQTLCYPHPGTPHHVTRTLGPRPRVFHLAETAMILLAALHKFLVRKRTFVTLFGTYELIK